MTKKKPTGINIDTVHDITRPAWDDGTPKSMKNDFNWKALQTQTNRLKAPQYESNNGSFNVLFSDNVNGI